jgi:ketosteroid isomerase-like protein
MTDEPAGQPVPEDIHRIAARLYQAFAAHDGRALRALLTPGFRGVVAEGMPHGFGGVYEGAETMLRDCWGPVFALVDLRPRPTEYLPVAADRMVVLGRYEGTARGTGRPLSAAFAHVLRFAGGRVSEIVQITDTARWHDALAPADDR